MLEAEFKQMVNMVSTTDLKGKSPFFLAQQVNLEILMLSRILCYAYIIHSILCYVNFWSISKLFYYISELIGI